VRPPWDPSDPAPAVPPFRVPTPVGPTASVFVRRPRDNAMLHIHVFNASFEEATRFEAALPIRDHNAASARPSTGGAGEADFACPLCGRAVPHPPWLRDGSLALAECDDCDLYFEASARAIPERWQASPDTGNAAAG